MCFRNIMKLAILTLVVCALLQHTEAEEVHVVGGNLGWTVPVGGPIVYDAWASLQDFDVGDILVFNFTNGDVARVTREAFLVCNKTNPISLVKTSPTNFTLDSAGDYYFISTLDQNCLKGQRVAIHVHDGPVQSPRAAPRGPFTYTVGDLFGWIVPPAGEIVYDIWAQGKTFTIGDSLVFYFLNGTQDVAVVTKEGYEKCETNQSTLAVYTNSPTRIFLNSIGEHFFTSTYPQHCAFGQKLAINVTASGSPGSLSRTFQGPSGSALAPFSSAPSTVVCGKYGYMLTLLFIGLAFII